MCDCGISFSEANTPKRVVLFVKSTGYKIIYCKFVTPFLHQAFQLKNRSVSIRVRISVVKKIKIQVYWRLQGCKVLEL